MPTLLQFPSVVYHNKFGLPALPPANSLQGKHVLITGGNTGLGLHTALHSLNLDAASVTITSRDAQKGELSKQWLTKQTTNKAGVVKVMKLDMVTLAGVVDFVERLKSEVRALDVGKCCVFSHSLYSSCE
jgi:NAD(P)-dependent dehydrogenase (short-subunit alcohol dehydrogenase family)